MFVVDTNQQLTSYTMENAPNSTFETCIICMERYSDTANKATQVTRCGHCFHAECYYAAHLSSKQRRQATRCPFCTRLVTTQTEPWIIDLRMTLALNRFMTESVWNDEDKQLVHETCRVLIFPFVKAIRMPIP